MATGNNRIVKNTAYLFFRFLLTMFIGLFSVRIVLKVLGDVDYGIYNVVGGIVTMMAFLNNALSSTTQRFLSFELGVNNLERQKKIFSTSMSLYGILCIIILIIAESIGLWFVNNKLNIPIERLSAANWVYQLSIFSFVCSILQSPYNAAIIAHEKMKIYAYVSISEAIIKLLMIFALLYIGNDKLILYSLMMTLTSFIVFFFYKSFCCKYFVECHYKIVFDRNIACELFSFAGWSTWGALSNIFKGQGVNIVLNMFFGVIVNTARGIAFQLDNAVNTLVQNFYIAVKPQIIKSYSTEKFEEVKSLIHMSTRLGYYLMLIPTIIFTFEMNMILSLWLGSVPKYAAVFTILVLVCNVILTIATPLMIVIHASGKVAKYQFLSGMSYMMVLPFTYLSVKYTNNPVSAFLVAIPFTFLYWGICYYFASKYVKLSIMWYTKLIFRLFVVTIIAYILPTLASLLTLEGILRLVVISFTSIFSSCLTIFLFGIESSERLYLCKKIKQRAN